MWRITFYGLPILAITLVYLITHYGTDIAAPFPGEIQLDESARIVSIEGVNLQ